MSLPVGYDDSYIISRVRARMILDSRGNPTVEVEVVTRGGGFGRAAAPAGASKGKHEALELRDGGKKFGGRGVDRALFNVNHVIAPRITGLDARMQRLIDSIMVDLDGTPNKSRLGANAIVATSLAVAKAAADTAGMPLYRYLGGTGTFVMPVPLMNIINGGAHAGNELSFQEFMIAPVGADSFSEALRIGVEVYQMLKKYLKDKYGASAINVGDEGGYAPPMKSNKEALDALVEAIKLAGYEPGADVVLGIDVAASQFYDAESGTYSVDGHRLSAEELLDYYLVMVDEYPIRSIEDPFYEEDYESFAKLTSKLLGRVLIVGDDLYVTNIGRLVRGIELKATTAALLKVNQVGTLTEALDYAYTAMASNLKVIVSHRSGETEDTTIAHLAVALRAGFIKTGAPARGERTAKYNELLRIEEDCSGECIYPGIRAYQSLHPVTAAYQLPA
ncbi:phosphopyruvate hydratase [Hyperthermus butylicus]|uniref:Enolase n=1 Tax=Hyperthermus butylicus (strain DSM 5456 / JCM 9403 / PLM1-5) TaxID=415426 RepID=A2BL98_HYPBU|nr:phosphopyruvate hydratase [Hyperthermus butylicus]ABM80759.1 Enolase (2-phosphoglycerate dehydratase) [Hyperthermus butylicus DSM 5456]